ncbi:MAG: hypothetical protein GY725_04525 [bacterium]|nr:hypothetical protein [bacterium]
MEKLIYLIWSPKEGDPDRIQKQLLQDCAPRLLELNPRGLSMNIDDSQSIVASPTPWPKAETPLAAEVCIWLDCCDRRASFERIFSEVGSETAGYLVTESLYTDYGGNRHGKPRDWPDGQRSPGVLTVTLLEKPASMSHDDWIDHWHGTQSPESEAIQPRARYVRNTVVRALTSNAPPYLGIVDEAWPSAEHISDPMLFFQAEGSREQMTKNIERMMASVSGFLELDRIRNVTMSEYLLKT